MTNIKKVAREGYLYAFKDEHGNYNFELENLLGQIEGPTKPILEKLNHCDGPVSITAEQKEILSSFVTCQAIRTPAYMNSLKGAYADFAKLMSQVHASNKGQFERYVRSAREAGVDLPEDLDVEKIREFALSGDYTIEVEESPYFLAQAMDHIEALYPCIVSKTLELLKSNSEYFITSDHPVVRLPDMNLPRFYRGGFLNSDLFFPVGNEAALYFRTVPDPNPPENPDESIDVPLINIKPSDTRKFNAITIEHAENYLYSCEENPTAQKLFDNTTERKRIRVSNPFEIRESRRTKENR